jgi:hypothetical protein
MWNIHGVIAPIAEGEDGVSDNRSPYKISIIDFVKNFSYTQDRCHIISKFLDYREKIYQLEINEGFQWVDGSFTENVEELRQRPPSDIDLVNFIYQPSQINEEYWAEHGYVFDHDIAKQNYLVDSYWVNLSVNDKEYIVNQTAYWYSMWSHQRDTNIWKGFYQIALTPQDDIMARQWLEGMIIAGETHESE